MKDAPNGLTGRWLGTYALPMTFGADSLVIVRGFTMAWFHENFVEMNVHFGGAPVGIPARDADLVGFYLEAPASAVTHVGIVEERLPVSNGITYKLAAIIRLPEPVATADGHAIRKHEYWKLGDLGVGLLSLELNPVV